MIGAEDTPKPDPWSRYRQMVWGATIAAALLMLAAGVLTKGFSSLPFVQTHAFYGLRFEPALPAVDFTLTNQDGQPVRLTDYQGKLILLVFGYTHCPDACPVTLSSLNRALEELGDARGQVQVLLISVDPESDTPAVLKEYLSRFNPAFVGLTGSPQEIEAVTRAYGVHVEDEGSTDGHFVAHTALTYVIDREGRQVLAFPWQMEPQEIAADLKFLLRR